MFIFNQLGVEQHGFIPDRSVEINLPVLLSSVAYDINVKLKLTLFILTLKKRLTPLTTDFYFINSNYKVSWIFCNIGFNLTLLIACKGCNQWCSLILKRVMIY